MRRAIKIPVNNIATFVLPPAPSGARWVVIRDSIGAMHIVLRHVSNWSNGVPCISRVIKMEGDAVGYTTGMLHPGEVIVSEAL